MSVDTHTCTIPHVLESMDGTVTRTFVEHPWTHTCTIPHVLVSVDGTVTTVPEKRNATFRGKASSGHTSGSYSDYKFSSEGNDSNTSALQ